jgi:hypothetical protein
MAIGFHWSGKARNNRAERLKILAKREPVGRPDWSCCGGFVGCICRAKQHYKHYEKKHYGALRALRKPSMKNPLMGRKPLNTFNTSTRQAQERGKPLRLPLSLPYTFSP